MRNGVQRAFALGAIATAFAVATRPAAAGPAGGLTGHQQREALERVVMVCENDPAIVCPSDSDDPGYAINGNQSQRILHSVCDPGLTQACVPLVVAEQPATLTIAATETAPDPLASCFGDPDCLNVAVSVGLDVPGSAASVAIERSFTHPTGFLRSPYCQGDPDSPGVRISDWFPFRNRDCLFADGINFEGMLLASNTPFTTPAGVAGSVDPNVVDFETALVGYAEDELGIPQGSVWPVTLLDAPDPAKGLLAGNAVMLNPSDLFDESIVGGTRTGSYPLTVRFAVAARAFEASLLVGSSPELNDRFGTSVAIDGAVAIVGQPISEVGSSGAAFVFRFDGTSWIPQGRLVAADETPNDYFGTAVAVAGDRVFVGAPQAKDGAAVVRGAVYVFSKSGGSWVQETKLLASDGAAGDRFGSSVAADGDDLWIGAPLRGNYAGVVYVFGRDGSGWSERAELGAATDGDFQFGTAVSLSGDVGAATAYHTVNPEFGTLSGAAYVFRRSGANWNQQARLVASDAGPEDTFESVAVSGDTLIAGSLERTGNPVPGAAYVFRETGGVWGEEAKIPAPPSVLADARFGQSVALDGNTALVGAVGAKRAYTFHRSGTSWTLERVLDSDGSFWFSGAVAIGRDVLLVGDSFAWVGGDQSEGRVHAFARPRATLVLSGTAQGGILRVVVRGVVTEIATAPGASAATIASALASALAGQSVLGTLRVFPASTQNGVELAGVDAGDIAVSTTDAGLTTSFATPCSNGEDDDGDGGVDLADLGCADAQDPSERSPLYACDDGADNDGDGATDFPADTACASPLGSSETPAVHLAISALHNDSSCAFDSSGSNAFVTHPYGSPPCGGPLGLSGSRFDASPTAVALSDTAVRLRLRAGSASDIDYLSTTSYNYLANFLGATFTLTVNVPVNQSWSVDLASVARGAAVTSNDSEPGNAMAMIEGAIAPFNVTIGPNAYSFTMPGWTTYIWTGQGGATACVHFEASRSDTSVVSGTGPGSFSVQVASILRTYSGGNEGAILFGIDDVLPSVYGSTTADNYSWNPAPGCGGRFAANDGYDITVTLQVPQPCADGVDNDGDGTIDFGSGASNDFGCGSVSDQTENDDAYQCDDGQDNDGDTLADLADPDCVSFSDTKESLGAECNDGVDNDGDGLVDYRAAGAPGYANRDPGCANELAFSRENPPCSDGFDNDHDGFVDFPNDPGCQTVSAAKENPQCDDDLDNDADAKIDADGGPLAGVPDPQCAGKPWSDQERTCGLGAELVLVMPLLAAARRRTSRRRELRGLES